MAESPRDFYIPDTVDAVSSLAYSTVDFPATAACCSSSSDSALNSRPNYRTVVSNVGTTVSVSSDPVNVGSSVDASQATNLSVDLSLPSVATAPQLDNYINELPPFRARCYSAPSVLYHQVALQLRSISDDFNSEYCNQQHMATVPQRRASLPATSRVLQYERQHHHQHQPARGVEQRANLLHNVIQSFRAAAEPRSHHSSISRVPEEMSDTDDIDETNSQSLKS